MNICFIGNNKESFVGDRIEGFSQYLESKYKIFKYYVDARNFLDNIKCFLKIISFLLYNKVDFVYLISQNPSRVLAVWLISLVKGFPFVVDTGDLLYEMYFETGNGSQFKLWLIKSWENISLRLPNAIIVRGLFHKNYLEKKGFSNVYYIPDGVDCDKIKRQDSTVLRKSLDIENKFTIGILATIGWHQHLKLPSPGWDLIDVLTLLDELPIFGVVIGDGPGLSSLKKRATEKGVINKIIFVGRIPYEEIPKYLSSIDVCVHTALNNNHSMVRTTGKLPIYLSCGSCIVASSVGTAKCIMKDMDLLVPFDGSFEDYIIHLSGKIKELYFKKDLKDYRIIARNIAEKKFDYSILSKELIRLFNNFKRHKVIIK